MKRFLTFCLYNISKRKMVFAGFIFLFFKISFWCNCFMCSFEIYVPFWKRRNSFLLKIKLFEEWCVKISKLQLCLLLIAILNSHFLLLLMLTEARSGNLLSRFPMTILLLSSLVWWSLFRSIRRKFSRLSLAVSGGKSNLMCISPPCLPAYGAWCRCFIWRQPLSLIL